MNDPGNDSPGNDPLFRDEAVRDYVRARTRGSLLRISPVWTSWAFWVLIGGALGALGFASLAEIDDWVGGPAVVQRIEPEGPSRDREVVVLLPAAERTLLEVGQPLLLQLAGETSPIELRIVRLDPGVLGPEAARAQLGVSAELVPVDGPVAIARATLDRGIAADRAVPGAVGNAEIRVGRRTLLTSLLPGARP